MLIGPVEVLPPENLAELPLVNVYEAGSNGDRLGTCETVGLLMVDVKDCVGEEGDAGR